MIPDDRKIYPLMQELAACLCDEVNSDGKMCFCGILVGDDVPVQMEGCENCGSAYVRLTTGYPSSQNFPQPDQGPSTCVTTWAHVLVIGVLRCYPGDPDGLSQEELVEVARQQLADMAAMRRAITCCLNDKFEDAIFSIGGYTPIPPAGLVVGGEITVTISEDL